MAGLEDGPHAPFADEAEDLIVLQEYRKLGAAGLPYFGRVARGDDFGHRRLPNAVDGSAQAAVGWRKGPD
jgi:hypothetical protein